MNIIKRKNIFLTISAILVIGSILAVAIFGFKTGIDFKGGTMWQIKLADNQPASTGRGEQLTTSNIKEFFETDLGLKNIIVFPSDNQSFLVRLESISESDHQKYLGSLKQKFSSIEELRFESIGPTIGSELKNKAIWAIILVLIGISLFVAYAFRKVSYPVKSWKYGVITLFTLFHDVIVPAGLIAILGKYSGVEIDTNFVVALLVVMGFSVHDTIVVFDRIRENLLNQKGKTPFDEIINTSINQTLARSINTSLTLILVLLVMFFFGPLTLKYFILTILVGTTVGAYSSIFVASPLLTIWHKYSRVN